MKLVLLAIAVFLGAASPCSAQNDSADSSDQVSATLSEKARTLALTAFKHAEKLAEITAASLTSIPGAHTVSLACGSLGASAGFGLGATGGVGLCIDLAGGKDIALHPLKHAYFMRVIGIGKVNGASLDNKLILLAGSINEKSSIEGHYVGTAFGSGNLLGIGSGAFVKNENPDSLDPLADKVFVYDVTLGVGAAVSLTADALDLKPLSETLALPRAANGAPSSP